MFRFLLIEMLPLIIEWPKYAGCIKRSGQSLWWCFRTLFGTKNPNTLFPNSSPFFDLRDHNTSVLTWFHGHFVAKFCSQLFIFSQLFSSKGWLEQMLKMSPTRTNTCFISLISCCTLPNLRWFISIAVVLIFPMSSYLLPISVSYTFPLIQPQWKKSNGVRSGDLASQATGLPLPIHLPGKWWSNHRRTESVKCAGTPSSWYHRCRRDCKGISFNIGITTSSMKFR